MRKCPKILEKIKASKTNNVEEANQSAKTADGYVAVANFSSANPDALKNWLLDTGSSDHMADDDCIYQDYICLSKPIEVRFGGGYKCDAIGVGNVLVASRDHPEYQWYLKDVLHVPGIGRKLVSMGKLMLNGADGSIGKDKIELKSSKGKLLEAARCGSMFPTDLVEIKPEANIAYKDEALEAWHKRLGHVNKARLVKMAKQDAVIGLEDLKNVKPERESLLEVVDCHSCVKAKLSRRPVPDRTSSRADEVGQVLHIDVCGPFDDSLSRNKYIVLFKDEFSNHRIAYCVKKKDQVFECIQKAFAQIMADTNKPVRKLFSDCGAEIINNKLNEFLMAKSASNETSAPFHPSQNGIIERENRTLLDAMRAMLFERKLPSYLWGEAAQTAVYLLNRTSNTVTKDKTPLELYCGRKPSLKHVRIFGCLAFFKTQEKKRKGYQKKLDPRGIPCMLVGYKRDFTYRLFEPEGMKVIITREAKFDEKEGLDVEMITDLDEIIADFYDDDQVETATDEHEESEVATAMIAITDGPITFKSAIQSKAWIDAMEDEYKSLMKNETWTLCTLPQDRKPISTKWIYNIKYNGDGTIARHKARFVARGFSQIADIDYAEIFAPVAKMDSIRMVLALVARNSWHMVQFDIRTAFLNGPLREEIYIEQPPGYVQHGENGQKLYCRLNEALYGLKQAPKSWNDCFTKFLKAHRLEPLPTDPCLMVRKDKEGNANLLLILYVDDGLVCGQDKSEIENLLEQLRSRFETKVFEPKCFIGLEIERKSMQSISIHQRSYTMKIIEKFGMTNCKTCETPGQTGVEFCTKGVVGATDQNDNRPFHGEYRGLIGCLTYLANGTRPDVSFIVNRLAAFSEQPKVAHWTAAKRIVRYLKGTANVGITYAAGEELLIAYSDADFAACVDSRRSTTGTLIKMCGGPVIWKSVKQKTVATSTVNAEFVAAALTTTEVIWARQQLKLSGAGLSGPTHLLVDNQGAIKLIKNNQAHTKIKHIDIKLLYIREAELNNEISAEFVTTIEQQADLLTKNIPTKQFKNLLDKMNLRTLQTVVCALAVASHVANAKTKWSKPRYAALNMYSACNQFRDMNDWWSGHEEGLIAICENHYFSRMDFVLKKMATCLPASRNRRDLGPLAAVAVDVVGHGLTNFVKSYFFPGKTDGTNYEAEVYHNLRKQTIAILESRDARTTEISKAITAFSESSSFHPEEVAVEASHVDTQYGASIQIFFENVAGFANLRTLYSSSKDGRVATKELGELLGNREIAETNSYDTRLDNVLVNSEHSIIHLIWREKVHEQGLELNTTGPNENNNLVMLDKLLDRIQLQPKQEPSWWFPVIIVPCMIPSMMGLFAIVYSMRSHAPSGQQNIELGSRPKTKKQRIQDEDSE